MSKNRRYAVRCLVSFTHIIPASILEIRRVLSSAYPDSIIEIPEKRIEYVEGQELELSSVRAVKNFIKFHDGKFEAL